MVRRKRKPTGFRALDTPTIKKFLKQVETPRTEIGRKNRQYLLRILRERKKK